MNKHLLVGCAGAPALVVLALGTSASLAMAGPLADGPPQGRSADAERGRAIVVDRKKSLCLLCHRIPLPDEPFQGDLGPDLKGVGSRLGSAQIRQHLVDPGTFNPDSIMPAFYRHDGYVRAGRAWEGRPILEAQELDDVVAWLSTLKETR